jgi:hypothetical protein
MSWAWTERERREGDGGGRRQVEEGAVDAEVDGKLETGGADPKGPSELAGDDLKATAAEVNIGTRAENKREMGKRSREMRRSPWRCWWVRRVRRKSDCDATVERCGGGSSGRWIPRRGYEVDWANSSGADEEHDKAKLLDASGWRRK